MGPHGVKVAARSGIAARKQRDVMPQVDQLVHQPRHYPLGAAVKLWRDALCQGCQLGDAHGGYS
jgi:hypothetical protein